MEVEVGGNVSFQCNSWGWNIPHSPLVMRVYTGLKGPEDKWIELLVVARTYEVIRMGTVGLFEVQARCLRWWT